MCAHTHIYIYIYTHICEALAYAVALGEVYAEAAEGAREAGRTQGGATCLTLLVFVLSCIHIL